MADEKREPLEYQSRRAETARRGLFFPRPMNWKEVVAAVLVLAALGGIMWAYLKPRDYKRPMPHCWKALRGIGLAARQYQLEYSGQSMPPDFATLARAMDIGPGQFVCPVHGDKPARMIRDNDDSARAAGNLSFIWVKPNAEATVAGEDPSERPLAIEAVRNHGGDGAFILEADGHVVWTDIHFVRQWADRLVKEGRLTQKQADWLLAK